MAKEKKKEAEDWMQRKWRPMMAMMYMIVCSFDFIVFPIMFTIVQFWETEAANDAFRQWQPISLLGGGLFHVAMGAVLGVTAWSRGQEKIAGAATNLGVTSNGNNLQTSVPTTYSQLQTGGNYASPNYNYAAMSPTASNNYTTTEYPRETTSFQTITGYKGKKAPMQPEDPII